MPLRSILLIGLAVIMAGATAMLARSLLSETTNAPAAPVTVAEKPATRVLVATRTLAVGELLARDDIDWLSWPDDRVGDSFYVEGRANPDSLVGHVVRYAVPEGMPVTTENLVAPGERGFLAAALNPGMRAVTVPVNAVSGVSGFVFPGDRVDLIVNHQVEDASRKKRLASETVVRNLRVLAVDTRTTPGNGGDGEPSPQVSKTVTLEATPKIAEKIALAQSLGTLSLALRSLETGAEPAGAVTATWDADVSAVLPPVDKPGAKATVTLSRGKDVSVLELPKD
ncbi:MAG: Flp pilus assembly protein CpaB [Alphaproteobacteria bacterium]|nr:MAG: Flp pilus assembly protein CpaB [Alphaproteobacteria bacterium]